MKFPLNCTFKVSHAKGKKKKDKITRGLSAVNAAVGGSFAPCLPFLPSLWSRGAILNFKLGVEPAMWPQPQHPLITEREKGHNVTAADNPLDRKKQSGDGERKYKRETVWR